MKIGPSIKTPCPAEWDKMKIGVGSRFCASCEKNVVDFTSKSRDEIIEFLILNYQTKTCGHFYRHQLDHSDSDFMVTVTSLAEKQKDPRLGLAILIFGSVVMAGCNSPAPHIANDSVDLLKKDTVEWVDKTEIIDSTIRCNMDIPSKNACATEDKPAPAAANLIPLEEITGDIAIDLEVLEGEVMMGDVDFKPDSSSKVPVPFFLVETKPEFPGGMENLKHQVARNTTYPKKAEKAKEQGKVFVSFIIDKEGKVIDPKIVRSISKSLDSAALHTISKLPDWTPGENLGNKVNVEFTIPVNFKLQP